MQPAFGPAATLVEVQFDVIECPGCQSRGAGVGCWTLIPPRINERFAAEEQAHAIVSR